MENLWKRSISGSQFIYRSSGWISSGPAALFDFRSLVAASISERRGGGLGSAEVTGKLLRTVGSGWMSEFSLFLKWFFYCQRILSVD